MRAGDEIDDVQHDDASEHDEQRARRAPARHREEQRGEQRGHAHDEQPVHRGTTVTSEVEGTGEVRRVEERDQPSARMVSGHAPRTRPLRRSRAEPVDQRTTDGEHACDHEHGGHRRPDLAVAEETVVVGVDEERDAARQVLGRVGGLHLPAFHRLRPLEPVQVQDRRCHVDHAHEAVFPRRRRAQQPPAEAGCPDRDRGERRAFRGRCRSHHDDRVALRVDVVEQPADEVVGVAQHACPQALALLVGRETAGQLGPHEVGPLHQHDRPIGPRLTEGIEHLVGIEPDAERRTAVDLQQATVDPPSRHLAVVGHQRRDRAATVRRHALLGRARVAAVAVGDHRPGDARPGELVTEVPDLGAVELAVVLLDHVVDRHVHQAAARREAGARREDTPGAVAPEVFVDTEALARGLLHGGGTRSRAERHVVAPDRARAVDAVGHETTDRRCREQAVEVGQVDALQIRPLDVREREDEHRRDRARASPLRSRRVPVPRR